MKATSPLEVPEILLSIASYLERRHVVICVKVCRSWNKLLKPLIWKFITIGHDSGMISPKGPFHGCFMDHSSHVIDLTITSAYRLDRYTTFPNLHTLELRFDANKHLNLCRSNPARLIALNPSLVCLSISVDCERNMDKRLWKAISSLPRLERLELFGVGLGSDEMDMFWEAFSKLQDVSLICVEFPDDGMQLEERSFSRIRKLYIDVIHTDDIGIIHHCTNIEDLEWYTRFDDNIRDALADIIEQGSLPKLERLRIHCHDERTTDKNLERIIGGMQKINSLSLSRTGFGPFSFQALRRHFSTITDLNLYSNGSVTSAMNQELLCSCPLLEKFQGKYIFAKDVVEGGEWACLSLKVLKAEFRFDESEQDLQPLIFKRLSSLILIEHFDISDIYYYRDGEKPCALDMRLASGLKQLSGWKNIKYLTVYGSEQSMEEVDIRWMVSNWPRLVSVSGDLNKDMYKRLILRMLLEQRDALVYGYLQQKP